MEENLQEELLTEEEQRFTVDNDQKADWAARKVAEIEADTAKWEKFYQEQIEKIRKANEFRAEYFRRMLKDYFYTVPHKMSKTQSSYQLPSGKLIMKAQGPEYKRDDETVMKWVYETSNTPHQFINTKETLNWSALKKALEGEDGIAIVDGQVATPDGEIVPGITVVERPNVFKVEVSK
jgi:phage host-nuclease inhibitor protein Gam